MTLVSAPSETRAIREAFESLRKFMAFPLAAELDKRITERENAEVLPPRPAKTPQEEGS